MDNVVKAKRKESAWTYEIMGIYFKGRLLSILFSSNSLSFTHVNVTSQKFRCEKKSSLFLFTPWKFLRIKSILIHHPACFIKPSLYVCVCVCVFESSSQYLITIWKLTFQGLNLYLLVIWIYICFNILFICYIMTTKHFGFPRWR